jgi:phosphatidylinositol glycan class Z
MMTHNEEKEPQTTDSRNKLSWILYSTLLVARIIIGPFLSGYVHPDEFFQGGQELFFGYPPRIPWEFEVENALRSVLPPGLLSYLPLVLYQKVTGQTSLSGMEILIVPRLLCGILSVLAVDWSVWSLSENVTTGVPTSVLMLASAWPTFVLLNRPFSNALETVFLALLLCNVLQARENIFTNKCMKVGALCALGLFTRFTFVFFAFPIMFFYLHDIYTRNNLRTTAIKLLLTTISFLLVGLAIVFLDTMFYYCYYNNPVDYSNLVITPWNALAYNAKVSNLKDHGLHPRWTHALVNMFLLYGPMTAVTYFIILKNESSQEITATTLVSRLVVISGLGLLSLAPHQEPRFLLPLIVPLSLIGKQPFCSSKTLISLWIIFNSILFGLFGVLHQSGVVKSLLTLGSSPSSTTKPLALLYYHTYMAPTFLLRSKEEVKDTMICQSETEENTCRQGNHYDILQDLNGSNLETLQITLDTLLSCSTSQQDQSSSTTEKKEEEDSYVYLVMPPMFQQDDSDDTLWSFTTQSCDMPGYNCQLISSHLHHLSTEDLPTFDGSLQNFYNHGLVLNTFSISCAPSRGENR